MAMIVVQLRGGLGNQLFQYAAGRRIALLHRLPLKLDISKLQNDSLRSYRLGHFNIQAEVATTQEVIEAKGGAGLLGKLKRQTDRLRPHYRRSWVKEQCYDFDPNILKITGTAFLEGYWQSEKYFKEIEKTLRDELTLKEPLSPASQQLADEIQATCSVSLHVRRGDYVSDPIQRSVYYLCPPEYYRAAVEVISRHVEQPRYFVFSDDPSWALENLGLDDPTTFVNDSGSGEDYEDLWLMSLCQHHITANSSFSWWGAWLGANPNKIVVAPSRWSVHKNKDRIPEDWLQL